MSDRNFGTSWDLEDFESVVSAACSFFTSDQGHWVTVSRSQTDIIPRSRWLCGARECSCKPARMRVAFCVPAGIISALALFLIKETIFSLSKYRQAPERQELAHASTCPIVTCLEPEVAELSVFLWLGYGRICCACSRVDPSFTCALSVVNQQPSESVVSD